MDIIATIANVINALRRVEVRGEENLEPLLGSINALKQVIKELNKLQEKPASDPEEDDMK